MALSKILLIEDNATDVLIVKHALRKQYSLDHVRTIAEGKQLLKSNTHTLGICASELPDGTAIALMRWTARMGIDVPIIITATEGDERVATDVLKLGAYDYLTKSQQTLSTLPMLIRQAETRHALEREAQLLQQIVENASDCIITMDMNGTILTANHATESMLEYTVEEVVGQPFSNLFTTTEEFNRRCTLLKAGKGKRAWHCELEAKKKWGEALNVDLSMSILEDRSGKPSCLIGIARDMTERNQLMEKLQHLSVTDDLTNLSNHRFFHDRLHYEYSRARRYNHSLGCIMIDVDFFKTVNDTYGHVAGDEALKAIGGLIASATRDTDIVARYGGEEFAILLPNTDLGGTVRCAENIRQTIQETAIETNETPLKITVSAGVASLTPNVDDEEDLLRRADAALLESKESGRNMVSVFRESEPPVSGRPIHMDGANVAEVRRHLRRLIQPAFERYVKSIRPVLTALYRRDPAFHRHSNNVTVYATELGKLADLTPEESLALEHAAEFHDIGHVATPLELLHRPGPLNMEERRILERHSVLGEQFMADLKVLPLERAYVRHHHEWYNGRGYPDGLAGERIPIGARILAIADAYDAMTSDRPFRPRMSEEAATQELLENAGIQFDPKLIQLFIQTRRTSDVT